MGEERRKGEVKLRPDTNLRKPLKPKLFTGLRIIKNLFLFLDYNCYTIVTSLKKMS